MRKLRRVILLILRNSNRMSQGRTEISDFRDDETPRLELLDPEAVDDMHSS